MRQRLAFQREALTILADQRLAIRADAALVHAAVLHHVIKKPASGDSGAYARAHHRFVHAVSLRCIDRRAAGRSGCAWRRHARRVLRQRKRTQCQTSRDCKNLETIPKLHGPSFDLACNVCPIHSSTPIIGRAEEPRAGFALHRIGSSTDFGEGS